MDRPVLDALRPSGSVLAVIGRTWMLHPTQLSASRAAGYEDPRSHNVVGRAGVVGDTSPEVATALLVIYAPALARELWEAGVAVRGAEGGARLYAEHRATWALEHVRGVPGLAELTSLGEEVVEAAPAASLPLFAAGRALPRDTDPTARAFQVALLLRELRGGLHLVTAAGAGLTPHELHVLNQGDAHAERFGWSAPHPDVEGLRSAYADVLERTDRVWARRVVGAVGPVGAVRLAQSLQDLADGLPD